MITRWLVLWRGRAFTRPPCFSFRVGDTKKSYHEAGTLLSSWYLVFGLVWKPARLDGRDAGSLTPSANYQVLLYRASANAACNEAGSNWLEIEYMLRHARVSMRDSIWRFHSAALSSASVRPGESGSLRNSAR